VVLQVIYTWTLTFGLVGFFRDVFSTESKAMRYISDSSYWLYLAHLPLIMLAQFFVQDVPAPALVKFLFVCVVVNGVLLLSYHWFVRYTPIGTLLNGKRTRVPRIPKNAQVD
jgi:peptidoglycan/LPS O-acetylase OafA/YrhL